MHHGKSFDPNRLRSALQGTPVAAAALAVERSVDTIRNWLAGRGEPRATELNQLAKLTGKPLDFFFTRAA